MQWWPRSNTGCNSSRTAATAAAASATEARGPSDWTDWSSGGTTLATSLTEMGLREIGTSGRSRARIAPSARTGSSGPSVRSGGSGSCGRIRHSDDWSFQIGWIRPNVVPTESGRSVWTAPQPAEAAPAEAGGGVAVRVSRARTLRSGVRPCRSRAPRRQQATATASRGTSGRTWTTVGRRPLTTPSTHRARAVLGIRRWTCTWSPRCPPQSTTSSRAPTRTSLGLSATTPPPAPQRHSWLRPQWRW
mmetsp:Transcript_24106/g.61532  ORF Transcript_24106/g.61532 Transcript_24106/m.61532 type:complete len:247 (-) Transcript_24106:510-1250(-)